MSLGWALGPGVISDADQPWTCPTSKSDEKPPKGEAAGGVCAWLLCFARYLKKQFSNLPVDVASLVALRKKASAI